MDKGLAKPGKFNHIKEFILAFGILLPIAISMVGGPDSYFWQAFGWMIKWLG